VNAGELAAVLLAVGAFVPGIVMSSRGVPHLRLVGLEFASVAAIMELMVLSVAWQRDSNLIVPLVLALISLPGTLVFTRLLTGKK
jgi:multisubunit Na+/H+ antiporter MnhF subunit